MDATLISQTMGTWDMRVINDDRFLEGKYFGLFLLDRQPDGSLRETKLEGFDISSRQFEFSDPDTLLVNHEYKGVYKLAVDLEAGKIDSYQQVEGIQKSSHSSLIRYDGHVLYANKYGIHRYDSGLGAFVKDEQLSALFDNGEYTSGKMVLDGEEYLWIFTRSYLCRIQPQAVAPSRCTRRC